MKNRTQYIILSILVLIILVMSIYYALRAYNNTIEFINTNNISAPTWNVKLNSDTYNEIHKDNKETINIVDEAVICNTTLQTPGDYYEFSINAENNGTIDAVLQKITINLPKNAQNYLKVTVYYDGQKYTKTTSNLNLPLLKDSRKEIKIKIAYLNQDQLKTIPNKDMTFTITVVFDFTQKNKEV